MALTSSLIGRLTLFVILLYILLYSKCYPYRADVFVGRGVMCVLYVSCDVTIYIVYIYTIFIFIHLNLYLYLYIFIPLLFTFINLQNISFADTSALSLYNTIANYILVRLGKNLLVFYSVSTVTICIVFHFYSGRGRLEASNE